MKVSITIWNNRIAPVFDVAGSVYIVDTALNTCREEIISLPQAPFAKIDALLRAGAEVLVCGAISRPLLRSAQGTGLKVVPFVSGSVTEVLDAWSAGTLEAAARTMPGCGCKQRGQCNHNSTMEEKRNQGCGHGMCRQNGNPSRTSQYRNETRHQQI